MMMPGSKKKPFILDDKAFERRSAQMKLMNTTLYPSTEKDIYSRAGKCLFFFTFRNAGIYVVY